MNTWMVDQRRAVAAREAARARRWGWAALVLTVAYWAL